MSKDSSFDWLEVQTTSLTQTTATTEKHQKILKHSSILRGPYLQQGSDSSITLRWATSTAVQGKVCYGTEFYNLDLSVTESAITCDHTVKLDELEPDTKYYYAIGSSVEVTDRSKDYFFVTAPAKNLSSEVVKPIRVWVVGDSGRGNDIAAQVRDGYSKFTRKRHTDLWLMLGDNAYDTGTWDEYQRGVFEMYPQILRNSVLWTTIGNHDAGSASSEWQTGPYYELFNPPTQGEAGGVASGTAAYYSFDYGNVHFICLDSYGSDRTPTGAMLTWAAKDIASSDKDWQIAFWHHPPYTKGSHDSDTEIELIEMRELALPILEAGGVDLVLSGHSHSYERSYLIYGHYGTSDTFTADMVQNQGSGREDASEAYYKPLGANKAGTVYIVAGTSALADEVSPHPAMHTSLSIPGSLVLDVQGQRLDVTFVDDRGEIQDYFTIKKG